MENNMDYYNNGVSSSATGSGTAVKSFMANVFSWMFAALCITGVFAWYFASSGLVIHLVNTATGGLSILGWIVMFAPLGFVLLMSFGYQRLSYPMIIALFILYAAINGISFSFILLAYTGASVAKTFFITAVTFGLMAVMGYTTKKDLTTFGSFMMMGLFGIVIASLINMFMHSDTMDYIISFVGVLVFTGLSGYHVQKLKRIGEGVEYGSESSAKLAVMGALTLYLDFVNLFLMLLRFFGAKRD